MKPSTAGTRTHRYPYAQCPYSQTEPRVPDSTFLSPGLSLGVPRPPARGATASEYAVASTGGGFAAALRACRALGAARTAQHVAVGAVRAVGFPPLPTGARPIASLSRANGRIVE